MEDGGASSDRLWKIRKVEKGNWNEIIQNLQLDADQWCNYTPGDNDVEFDDNAIFYAAVDEGTRQTLALAAASKHGARQAYICMSMHRSVIGTPTASALFSAAFEYVADRNILADLPSGCFPSLIYENHFLKSFKESPWCVLRYAGVPSWRRLQSLNFDQLHVCHAQMIRSDDIAAFDRSVSGQNRHSWLRRLLKHSNDQGIPRSVHLVATDRRGEIRGYGCVRPGIHRARIGPIYARDPKTFLLLFRNLMGSSREARSKGIELAVCSANRQAMDILESVCQLGRQETGQGLQIRRMYTKWQPHVAWEHVYCLTNSITQPV